MLLSVGRAVAKKGYDDLIAALALLPKDLAWRLVHIGGGALADKLEEQAARVGLAERIEWRGARPQPEVLAAYRAADINVVPTTALEGFGLTAAEALAAGTPSMVTPIGGLPEVVADLSPDLIFTSCETPEVASGLIAALKGEIGIPDSATCRAYAETRFANSLAAQRTAGVYRELLA